MKSLDIDTTADQALPLRASQRGTLPLPPRAAKPRRYGYHDCLDGTAPVPQDALGHAIFSLLMAGGMVTVMTTFNGVRHGGIDFVITSHWLYPLVFCIAMTMRFLYANRVVDFVAPRWIRPHLGGIPRTIAMTLLNVGVMAPVMCSIVTLLLKGASDLPANIAAELPLSLLVAILVNLLAVGPAVRLLYHNVILPATGSRLINATQRFATTWAGIFTS